jgi:putative transposase
VSGGATAHADAGAWAWLERQPASVRAEAEARLAALDAVEALVAQGLGRREAVDRVAAQRGLGRATLYRYAQAVAGRPRGDWLPALAPRCGGGRQPAELPEEGWSALTADYLRPSRPAFSDCYRRLAAIAAAEGWRIPSERTLLRRVQALPEAPRVLARDGVEALRRLFPAQQRDRGVFHALEAVCADGHRVDVFVRWPDGTVARPELVAFQDLYSGKLLSWRVDRAPSWHAVRLAFGDLVEQYGIPAHCWLDNGREFAAKRITGGAPNRYRWRLREEEPAGLLTSLGVQVHWTTPYHGQAKPIERAFRDLAQSIARHPAFEGAYTGPDTTRKPANYGSRAVDLETFLRVLGEGIAEHNARPGRRSPTCAGRSFDQTFAESYATAPIRRASEAQRRLWLLAADLVRVRQDGTIRLYDNRYWAEWLLAHRGRSVTVRFDPEALAEPLHVYAADGRYLGAAECQEAAGFADVAAAQEQARRWRQFLRATRQAAALQDRMSLDELVRRLPAVAAAEPPQRRVVRPLFGRAAAAAVAVEDSEAEERVLAALRGGVAARRALRVIDNTGIDDG